MQMYKCDKTIMSELQKRISHDKTKSWKHGFDRVDVDGKWVRVSYRDNEIFTYDTDTGKWWIDDCDWPTRTTRNRINACLKAFNRPIECFISKGRFCLRNTDLKLEVVIGDGQVSGADIYTAFKEEGQPKVK